MILFCTRLRVPHVDGVEVKASAIASFLTTDLQSKPILIGTVTDESTLYTNLAFPFPIPVEAYYGALSVFLPNITRETLGRLYPVDDPSDTVDALSQISSDYVFTCPTRRIAAALSGQTSVYMYLYNQTLDFDALDELQPPCERKVCHEYEVPVVFQSARVPPFVLRRDMLALSDKLIAYWTAFARYGNPNKGQEGHTDWDRYKTRGVKGDSIIEFKVTDSDFTYIQGHRKEQCDEFDNYGYA